MLVLVFQYGSNCDVARLRSRVRTLRDDGVLARTSAAYDVEFTVWSDKNGCAAADLVEAPGQHAWGILYELTDEEFDQLRRVEGKRYRELAIVVDVAGVSRFASTFVVREDERRLGLWTSAAYVHHIVVGLRSHRCPEDYIQHVIGRAIETNTRAANCPCIEEMLLLALLS